MFKEVRDYIVERGLKDCRRLLREGRGPEGFYDGAVDGFDACRGFEDLASLKARIRELQVEEHERRSNQLIWGLPSKLREWWYWRGYLMQLQFVWDRLSLVEPITHVTPDTDPVLSARAVMDVLTEILPAIRECQ